MLKDFFNKPANPFHDENEPSFLSIGNLVTAVVYTAAIIGGGYAIAYSDVILDHFKPEANSVEEPVTTGAAQHLPPFALQTLG